LRRTIALFAVLFLVINGCNKQLERPAAETIAVNYVSSYGKFYVRNGSSLTDANKPEFSVLNSYNAADEWDVIIQISQLIGNQTKKASVVVKLDAKTGIVRGMENYKP
jgi:hypothetical protein